MAGFRSGRNEVSGLLEGLRMKLWVEDDENGLPRRSLEPKNVICSQFWYLRMSKYEFGVGNQESLGPEVSGDLREVFWAALDSFLDRPSPPKASKRPKIQFLPSC